MYVIVCMYLSSKTFIPLKTAKPRKREDNSNTTKKMLYIMSYQYIAVFKK